MVKKFAAICPLGEKCGRFRKRLATCTDIADTRWRLAQHLNSARGHRLTSEEVDNLVERAEVEEWSEPDEGEVEVKGEGEGNRKKSRLPDHDVDARRVDSRGRSKRDDKVARGDARSRTTSGGDTADDRGREGSRDRRRSGGGETADDRDRAGSRDHHRSGDGGGGSSGGRGGGSSGGDRKASGGGAIAKLDKKDKRVVAIVQAPATYNP